MVAALVTVVADAALRQQPWGSEPAFRMSAKSSITVLPFANLSKDAEDEYFSDGITIDIITDLSKFHDPFVQGRNSFLLFRDPTDAARVTKGLRKAGIE